MSTHPKLAEIARDILACSRAIADEKEPVEDRLIEVSNALDSIALAVNELSERFQVLAK